MNIQVEADSLESRHATALCTLRVPAVAHRGILRCRRRTPTEFVVGKNYRLQDIQLSKIRLRPCGPRRGKLATAVTHLPILSFSRPPRYSLPRAGSPLGPAKAGLPSRSPPPLPQAASARRSLVENTGLEPVTSWLQTRRSPS